VLFYEWDSYISILLPINAVWILKLSPAFLIGLYLFFDKSKLQIYKVAKVEIYFGIFAAFLFYGLIVTLLKTAPAFYLKDWLKIVFRFGFIVVALPFLNNTRIIKMLGLLSVFVCIQYIFLLCDYYSGNPAYFLSEGWYWGPWGMYGNQIAGQHILGVTVTRLTGFWREPAILSGFLSASFYLLRSLKRTYFWISLSYLTFFLSLLCLSNAGYLGLIWGATIWWFLDIVNFKSRKDLTSNLIKFSVACILSIVVLFGRNIFYNSSNVFTRSVLGIRATVVKSDPLDGRVDTIRWTFEKIKSNPWGAGLRMSAESGNLNELPNVSSTAPFYWLYFLGPIGFLLLIFQNLTIVSKAKSFYSDQRFRNLFSGFVALSIQQLSYGAWITPYFLLLGGMVLSYQHRDIET
jgi:hypothetical protein